MLLKYHRLSATLLSCLTLLSFSCTPDQPNDTSQTSTQPDSQEETVSFSTAQSIIQKNCLECHSANPTRSA